MLYIHLLIFMISGVGVILLCALAAIFGSVAVIWMTGIPRDNSSLAIFTILIWAPLCFFMVPRYGRIFAKHVAARCPNCRTWAARMMFTHPISFRCSACGKHTKLQVFLDGGLTQDCPKCGEHLCFKPTGGKIPSGPRQLLAFRCSECGHFDYGEEPPINTA